MDTLQTQSATYLAAAGFSAIAALLAIVMVAQLVGGQERSQSIVSSPTPARAVATVPV
jgi:hypothetical protein